MSQGVKQDHPAPEAPRGRNPSRRLGRRNRQQGQDPNEAGKKKIEKRKNRRQEDANDPERQQKEGKDGSEQKVDEDRARRSRTPRSEQGKEKKPDGRALHEFALPSFRKRETQGKGGDPTEGEGKGVPPKRKENQSDQARQKNVLISPQRRSPSRFHFHQQQSDPSSDHGGLPTAGK